MDDIEDDARYPPNPYPVNHHQQSYGSLHRPKLPVRNASYAQPVGNEYGDEDDDDEDGEEGEEEEEVEEEEEDEEEEEGENGVQRVVEDAAEDDDEEEDEDGDDDDRNDYHRRMETEEEELERHRKKRKLKNLGYEFAPRVAAAAAPSVTAAAAPKPLFGGRNSTADWTEHATFVLLDAWGDRFLQHGRKSLRSDEWQEVADKVSQASKTERTDTQCRNRLDTLKKKYKKVSTPPKILGPGLLAACSHTAPHRSSTAFRRQRRLLILAAVVAVVVLFQGPRSRPTRQALSSASPAVGSHDDSLFALKPHRFTAASTSIFVALRPFSLPSV